MLSVSLKKLPWFIFKETVDYIRIELFAIVFGSLTKFLSLIFIMLQWNGSLYITLIVQMLTSSGFDYGLGTIHILRQHIFGLFLPHPLCQHKYSTQRQQNWPFSRPTQSFRWRNIWMVPRISMDFFCSEINKLYTIGGFCPSI